MSEDNKEVVEEVKQEIAEHPEQHAEEQSPQEQPAQALKGQDQKSNWQAANEVMRLQREQIDALKARAEAYEAQLQAQVKASLPEEKDEFADLDQEEYLTVANARKMAEKLSEKKAKEAAKQIVQEYAREQTLNNDEQRARGKYSDYDYVIENFAIPAIKNDPALAHKIASSKNPAETAYKLGKLSDAYEEQTQKQTVSPKAERIMKNTQRPVSGAAATSPLKGQADSFAKMSNEDVWKLSQQYAKGY